MQIFIRSDKVFIIKFEHKAFGIFLQGNKLAAILKVHCNRELFTLN